MQSPWKLLAALGGINLAVGIVVLAVGLWYDWIGRAPGQIAMVGVAMMSWPFLTLSAIFRSHAKSTQRRLNAEAEEAEGRLAESRIRKAVATGSFATLSLRNSEDDR